jgi:folate-binding protein YgfZ
LHAPFYFHTQPMTANEQNVVLPEEYQAAISGSAYYFWENPGFLRISGTDRRAFLQRQTTNDLQMLKPAGCLVTVLTNPAARILDVLTLVDETDSLLAITLPGHAEATHHYLRSRIFFNDKVSVANPSQEMVLIDLLGPGIADLLGRLGIDRAPDETEVAVQEIKGITVQVIRQHGLGYRLVCQTGQVVALLKFLDQAGLTRLSYETFDILRIEAGVPAGGQELTDEYTPLEAGLGWAISGSKGCYTGQEVIARQMTYDKVTRHLAGIRLERPAQAGEKLYSPEEDRQIGEITSTAVSPRLGPLALAILRRPFDEPGRKVTLGEASGPAGKVVSLPF